MEPENLFPCSEQPATLPALSHISAVQALSSCCFKCEIRYNIALCLGTSKVFLQFRGH
jgi:hypothetical protein